MCRKWLVYQISKAPCRFVDGSELRCVPIVSQIAAEVCFFGGLLFWGDQVLPHVWCLETSYRVF